MAFDQHQLGVALQRLKWARNLTEEVIQDIVASAGFTEYQAGQVVIELNSDIQSIFFVITGRLEGALFDRLGKEIRRDTFRRGSVVGLFSAFLSESDRSHFRVEAAEGTTAIHLALDDLLRLTAKHREFQLAMLRIAADITIHNLMVDRDLPRPAAVAMVHHSDASRPLAVELARRLRQLGESPCVAGDDVHWRPEEGIPHRLLFEDGVYIGPERIVQLLKEWVSHDRLLIDFRTEHSPDDLGRILDYADIVLWCLRPREVEAALRTLKVVEPAVPRLREKVCLVWVLDHDAPTPPYVQELYEFAALDFKTYSGEPKQGRLLQQGVERIVHHLRGVRIGLALGGGAARGMAHLGVLKALEQHGIFVDMIAGTSAGAMVGGIYGAGLDSGFITDCFKEDLMPSWLFRQLPGGGYWYLLFKYRLRRFEPMLRKYLGDIRMEQLVIPVMMISVDLVDGVPLVRDRGDATHNILESINLPPLSLPIVRQDQAVVDGGLLNNVPANALVARGCNFVIASTVTAQLEKDFMGLRRPGTSRSVTTMQVIMRQNMIQSYSMNAVGVEPADFVIAPDVSSFDMSEFTRADEMAVIGEETTNASVHRLKAMLSKLDPKLF